MNLKEQTLELQHKWKKLQLFVGPNNVLPMHLIQVTTLCDDTKAPLSIYTKISILELFKRHDPHLPAFAHVVASQCKVSFFFA